MTFVCGISVHVIVPVCAHAVLVLLSGVVCGAQIEHPIPFLTGDAGDCTNVEAGQTALVPEVYRVLLIPGR